MLDWEQDVQIRVCLFEVVGEGVVYGDVEASGECDLRVFGGFREWVVGWELGPEIWIGFLCLLVLCLDVLVGMDEVCSLVQPIPDEAQRTHPR